MKKLFYLFAVLTFVGCSSSDDDSNNNSSDNNAFHPPSWVHGTWSFDEETVNGFVFDSNSFCSIFNTQQNCFPEQELEGTYRVDEEISDTDYTITIIQSSFGQVIQTNTYHFIKVDSDHIYFDDPILDNRMMYKLD